MVATVKLKEIGACAMYIPKERGRGRKRENGVLCEACDSCCFMKLLAGPSWGS